MEGATEGGSESLKDSWSWGRGSIKVCWRRSLEEAEEGRSLGITWRKSKATGKITRPYPGDI